MVELRVSELDGGEAVLTLDGAEVGHLEPDFSANAYCWSVLDGDRIISRGSALFGEINTKEDDRIAILCYESMIAAAEAHFLVKVIRHDRKKE